MIFAKNHHGKPEMLVKKIRFPSTFSNSGDYFGFGRLGGNFNNRETPERIGRLGPYEVVSSLKQKK